LISFDKEIIEAGFNFFIFLYGFKQVIPEHKELKDCDFMFQNDDLYAEFKDQLLPLFRKMT